MGRPRKSESERKVAQMNLHLTLDEEKKVLEWARASCLSPHEWARRKIFTGRFPPIRISPIEASVYQELRRIGVNLNQGTHKLNSGERPKDYLTLQMELLSTLDKIYKLLLKEEGT